jgi:hypothetical protein
MKKNKCLIPECKRPVVCRGLCKPCYTIAAALVRKKVVPSFEELVRAGKVLGSPRRSKCGSVLEYLTS